MAAFPGTGGRRSLAELGEGEEFVHPDQTVSEMAQEVIRRQARMLVDQSGQTLEKAMSATLQTDAARQLKELARGEWKAAEWQTSLPRARAEEPHYSWLESYMEWLGGKERRPEYHAFLEEELSNLRG
jgi:hypothetical protein